MKKKHPVYLICKVKYCTTLSEWIYTPQCPLFWACLQECLKMQRGHCNQCSHVLLKCHGLPGIKHCIFLIVQTVKGQHAHPSQIWQNHENAHWFLMSQDLTFSKGNAKNGHLCFRGWHISLVITLIMMWGRVQVGGLKVEWCSATGTSGQIGRIARGKPSLENCKTLLEKKLVKLFAGKESH